MKREFCCAGCGATFTLEADYFEPGISGTLVLADGSVRTFIDPTNKHRCPACVEKATEELYKKFGGQGNVQEE